MRRFSALAATVVLLLSGCAAKKDAGGEAAVQSYKPDELVLRVDVAGGFVPAEVVVTALPTLSVYGDGRVVSDGPQIEIYPGPALPNVQVQQISQADIARLVDLAVEAGVGKAGDLGMPAVADAPTTTFTVLTGAGKLVTDAPALGIAEEQLPAGQQAARKKLQTLVEQLTDLPKTLGKSVESKPFAATATAVIASPWKQQGGDEGLPPQPAQEWPGPALPGAAVPNMLDLHCVVASGEQATKVLAAAAKANSRTPWTSSGSTWQVAFRPLLPGETACDDLHT